MKKLLLALMLICLAFISSSLAADLTLEQLIDKIQANQSKIKDMYAETTTKITSNIQLKSSKDSGPQTMTQKGRMWTKGEDKSKIEMLSPTKQITITNGDKMAIINPETGQKIIKQLNKTQLNNDVGKMSLEKAKEYFDLSVRKLDALTPGNLETYVITGVPRKENKFLGKMEFYVDGENWVPVKILMYGSNGQIISRSEIEYQEAAGAWVPAKNMSNVTTPMGAMKIEMEYANVKVNQGVSDKEFEVD